MYLFLQIVSLLLLADFISGIGHWFEDAYGNPNWYLFGNLIIKPNLEHHRTPRSFLSRSYWSRNDVSILFCAFSVLCFYFLGFFSWQLLFVFTLLSQVNEVHAISHRRKDENSSFILFLQEMGLIQSSFHHGWHHKAPYDCNYCILTEYLNPILNKIKFWVFLESCILFLFKARPLRGSSIRGGI